MADLRARVQERDVQIARLADLERELQRVRDREWDLLDLIYQEKGEKRALLDRLPQLPALKDGFWARVFRGRGGE